MPDTPHCYGIDLGAISVVGARDDGELLRNELGGHTTASLVSFSGKERLLGEAAANSLTGNGRNTATTVGRLALQPHSRVSASPYAMHWQFKHAARDSGALELEVQYNGESRRFSGVQLLGALLAKVRTAGGAGDTPDLALAVPACVEVGACAEDKAASLAFARAALLDAAAIGGWRPAALPTAMEAAAVALSRKYPAAEAAEEPTKRHVLLVDMGATTTSVAVICVDAPAGEQLVSEVSDCQLGCADLDGAMWVHFAEHCRSVHKIEVAAGSRAGQRLLDACERLRKLLSTLPSAAATAENLGDGVDVPLSLSRDEMGALGAPVLERLRALLDTALSGAPVLSGIELLGGGTRMPSVQATLVEALAASDAGAAVAHERFGAKLDDGSIATGAALLARAAIDAAAAAPEGAAESGAPAPEGGGPTPAGAPAPPALSEAPGRLEGAALSEMVAAEAAMVAADMEAASLSALRNELEGLVLEARGRRGRKHGELVDGATLEPLLDQAEDWLYSDEGEAADAATLQAKLTDLKEQVGAACKAYLDALAADKQKEEAVLEAAAAAAAAEKAARGDEDEDHDNRRLKFPDRLRMVQKNKEEGTELFKGQNYRPAAARYNKALTHAAKFVDLSPDQKAEVDGLKVSLNLNLAQCWLKITDAANHLDQAVRCCDEALKLDEDNVKALYRRAAALEAKGEYDQAKAGLSRAATLAPDDSAVSKLMVRIDAQLKRQAEKEKKMYAKMFG